MTTELINSAWRLVCMPAMPAVLTISPSGDGRSPAREWRKAPWMAPGLLSPTALRTLTSRLLCAEVQLQVEVLHHVTQLVIVGVLPELQERADSSGPKEQARLCGPSPTPTLSSPGPPWWEGP